MRPGRVLDEEWSHLFAIQFLFLPGASRPPQESYKEWLVESSKRRVLHIEAFEGSTLHFEFCKNVRTKRKHCPLLDCEGVNELVELPLRSGGAIVALFQRCSFDAYAREHIRRFSAFSSAMLANLAGKFSAEQLARSYSEPHLFKYDDVRGNHFIVIPQAHMG